MDGAENKGQLERKAPTIVGETTEGLPEGWTKLFVRREAGKYAGRCYATIVTEDGAHLYGPAGLRRYWEKRGLPENTLPEVSFTIRSSVPEDSSKIEGVAAADDSKSESKRMRKEKSKSRKRKDSEEAPALLLDDSVEEVACEPDLLRFQHQPCVDILNEAIARLSCQKEPMEDLEAVPAVSITGIDMRAMSPDLVFPTQDSLREFTEVLATEKGTGSSSRREDVQAILEAQERDLEVERSQLANPRPTLVGTITDGLPDGWVKAIHIRRTCQRQGSSRSFYAVIKPPDSRILRSGNDLAKYIADRGLDPEDFSGVSFSVAGFVSGSPFVPPSGTLPTVSTRKKSGKAELKAPASDVPDGRIETLVKKQEASIKGREGHKESGKAELKAPASDSPDGRTETLAKKQEVSIKSRESQNESGKAELKAPASDVPHGRTKTPVKEQQAPIKIRESLEKKSNVKRASGEQTVEQNSTALVKRGNGPSKETEVMAGSDNRVKERPSEDIQRSTPKIVIGQKETPVRREHEHSEVPSAGVEKNRRSGSGRKNSQKENLAERTDGANDAVSEAMPADRIFPGKRLRTDINANRQLVRVGVASGVRALVPHEWLVERSGNLSQKKAFVRSRDESEKYRGSDRNLGVRADCFEARNMGGSRKRDRSFESGTTGPPAKKSQHPRSSENSKSPKRSSKSEERKAEKRNSKEERRGVKPKEPEEEKKEPVLSIQQMRVLGEFVKDDWKLLISCAFLDVSAPVRAIRVFFESFSTASTLHLRGWVILNDFLSMRGFDYGPDFAQRLASMTKDLVEKKDIQVPDRLTGVNDFIVGSFKLARKRDR